MKNTNPAAESGAFIRRARGYSVVQNEALFNDRLSMSAKGSYALISARIDYTAVPLTTVVKMSKDCSIIISCIKVHY